MNEYGWMLLEVVGEPKHIVMGPSDLDPDIEHRLVVNGEGERFLLMCGDNKMLARGRIITLDDDPASMTELGFAPLDDYGEPSLGAAGIKYRSGKTGKYEYL